MSPTFSFINRASLYSVASFCTGGVVGTLFFEKVLRITTLEGPSMEPIFHPKDKAIGVSLEAWCFFFRLRQKIFSSFSSSSSSSQQLPLEDENPLHNRIVVCEVRPGTNYCKLAKMTNHSNSSGNTGFDRLTLFGVNANESIDSREMGDFPLSSVRSVVLCKISPEFVWLSGKKFEIK